MILSDRKAFLAIGGSLLVLGMLSFVAVVVLKVATGHSLAGYNFVNVMPRTYAATFVMILFAIGAILVVGGLRFIAWYRQHLHPDRDP